MGGGGGQPGKGAAGLREAFSLRGAFKVPVCGGTPAGHGD